MIFYKFTAAVCRGGESRFAGAPVGEHRGEKTRFASEPRNVYIVCGWLINGKPGKIVVADDAGVHSNRDRRGDPALAGFDSVFAIRRNICEEELIKLAE